MPGAICLLRCSRTGRCTADSKVGPADPSRRVLPLAASAVAPASPAAPPRSSAPAAPAVPAAPAASASPPSLLLPASLGAAPPAARTAGLVWGLSAPGKNAEHDQRASFHALPRPVKRHRWLVPALLVPPLLVPPLLVPAPPVPASPVPPLLSVPAVRLLRLPRRARRSPGVRPYRRSARLLRRCQRAHRSSPTPVWAGRRERAQVDHHVSAACLPRSTYEMLATSDKRQSYRRSSRPSVRPRSGNVYQIRVAEAASLLRRVLHGLVGARRGVTVSVGASGVVRRGRGSACTPRAAHWHGARQAIDHHAVVVAHAPVRPIPSRSLP